MKEKIKKIFQKIKTLIKKTPKKEWIKLGCCIGFCVSFMVAACFEWEIVKTISSLLGIMYIFSTIDKFVDLYFEKKNPLKEIVTYCERSVIDKQEAEEISEYANPREIAVSRLYERLYRRICKVTPIKECRDDAGNFTVSCELTVIHKKEEK